MLSTVLKALIEAGASQGVSLPNVPTPTMGGEVWWNDLAVCNGWRLQQNMITQHARILDPDDVRHAWGDVRAMEVKFAQITSALKQQTKPL